MSIVRENKMSEKVTYKIEATFKSGKLLERVTSTYPNILKRVNRYYNVGYQDMGKAEAVELTLLTKTIDKTDNL